MLMRTLRGMMVVGLLTGSLAIASRGFAQDENKCKLATKPDGPVGKACAEGGMKKAKQTMKELVKAAKAGGVKFDCDDCHKDDAKYEILTDDGKEKFKKLLAAAQKK
jgi:hypothetical protein